jgi:hypothetical protein
MNWRIVFSIVVGYVVLFALGHFVGGAARCADGWVSPSIGHRGACSHHHGVAGPSIVDLLGLVLAIAAGFLAHRYVWGPLSAAFDRVGRTWRVAIRSAPLSRQEPYSSSLRSFPSPASCCLRRLCRSPPHLRRQSR